MTTIRCYCAECHEYQDVVLLELDPEEGVVEIVTLTLTCGHEAPHHLRLLIE